jgi:hypothetical protein
MFHDLIAQFSQTISCVIAVYPFLLAVDPIQCDFEHVNKHATLKTSLDSSTDNCQPHYLHFYNERGVQSSIRGLDPPRLPRDLPSIFAFQCDFEHRIDLLLDRFWQQIPTRNGFACVHKAEGMSSCEYFRSNFTGSALQPVKIVVENNLR